MRFDQAVLITLIFCFCITTQLGCSLQFIQNILIELDRFVCFDRSLFFFFKCHFISALKEAQDVYSKLLMRKVECISTSVCWETLNMLHTAMANKTALHLMFSKDSIYFSDLGFL